MTDVSDRVKKIVLEHLGVEEEFNVEIPDDAAEKILTIKDAIKFIESQNA